MADNNALLRELHAARNARRGGGGPSEPAVPAQEAPAPAAPAARAREVISIGDSDDDAAPAPAAAPAREGVIEIFDSDSDDEGGLAAEDRVRRLSLVVKAEAYLIRAIVLDEDPAAEVPDPKAAKGKAAPEEAVAS